VLSPATSLPAIVTVPLDKILTMSGEKLLQGAGKVSHEKAVEKATAEYKKYQQKTLSEVEKSCLDALKSNESKAEQKTKMK
jgi:hypothetical protein